jgi:hypothetical protein
MGTYRAAGSLARKGAREAISIGDRPFCLLKNAQSALGVRVPDFCQQIPSRIWY